jgi:signal peptidase I
MFQSMLTAVLDAGYAARFVARGDSMHPTIRDGEALHIERCDPRSLRVGEIVLARAERGLTAHRVVSVRCDTAQIVTRGDNCPIPDPPLDPGQIVGRVVRVERNRARIGLLSASRRLLRVIRTAVRW